MTELVLDTTRAIHNMLWNGTFAKFPNIRWIMPHGGGAIPFLTYRLTQMDYKRPDKLIGGTVAGTLRALWYDVAEICAPAPLAALMKIAEPSRILFGSDYPFSRHKSAAQDVSDLIAAFEAADGFDAAARRGIERDNALKLFPRLAQAIARAER
jgi:predicted TIM-barrel fold metal-dependent hydrolase